MEATEFVFVKDYWRVVAPGMKEESDIYQRLEEYNVPNIAPFGNGNDVLFQVWSKKTGQPVPTPDLSFPLRQGRDPATQGSRKVDIFSDVTRGDWRWTRDVRIDKATRGYDCRYHGRSVLVLSPTDSNVPDIDASWKVYQPSPRVMLFVDNLLFRCFLSSSTIIRSTLAFSFAIFPIPLRPSFTP